MEGLRGARWYVPGYFNSSKVTRGQGLHLLLHQICGIIGAWIVCWRWQQDSSGSMAENVVIPVIIAVGSSSAGVWIW